MGKNKSSKKLQITVITCFIFICAILIFAYIYNMQNDSSDDPRSQHESSNQNEGPVVEPEAPKPYTTEVKLLAVGDIMMHEPQIPAGYDATTKTYNYDSFFSEVKSILQAGDWVIGNLETPIAGAELGLSGYPQFNAPAELADSLKNAGFNILTTANNHSLDRREKGVLLTLKHLREREILNTGMADSEEAAKQILTVSKNEIDMAVLAYTYGTNGIPFPEGKEYLVPLIDEDKIIEDIARARELDVDLVTIALHFGNEYQQQPNDIQKNLVRKLIEAGADLILGSHAHVLQPYEFVEVTNEDGQLRKGLVIYSMGNFISNQDRTLTNHPTDVGVIFQVVVRKQHPEETIEFTNVQTVPTYVHRYIANGKRQYRVLPLPDTVTLKQDHLLKEQDYNRLETYWKTASAHLESLTIPVSGNE